MKNNTKLKLENKRTKLLRKQNETRKKNTQNKDRITGNEGENGIWGTTLKRRQAAKITAKENDI